MRTPPIAIILVLLAGAASAQQQGSTSYTPDRKTESPSFMNAEVVRVDQATNRITFRSESRETTLTVEGDALRMIGSLHAGDKVVVGYRAVTGPDGRETRYVTSVAEASPTSGEPRRVTMAAGSSVRARVLDYDRRKRRVTVIDETGNLRALAVQSTAPGISALVPGANVAFNLGAAGSGVNVSGVTSLGDTSVFGNGIAFPPVNGRLVSFDRRTGVATLDTPNAGRVAFPVGTGQASGFGGLRPGQDLSLNFDVDSAQAGSGGRTSVGTVQPLARITGVQPAIAGTPGVQAAGVPGAVSPIAQNTVSPNAPGLAGTPGVQQGGNQQGVQQGANQQGTNAQGTNAGGTGGVTGGAVAGGVTPGSVGGTVGGVVPPLSRQIPSVPGGSSIPSAVLPPAGARDPLSAEDVGNMRAQGEADLANAAVALAAAALPIDAAWSGFKTQCLGGFTPESAASGREWYLLAQGRILTPNDDACRALYSDLTARANGFIQQLDIVEDAARKADVLPVRVREVMDRHQLR